MIIVMNREMLIPDTEQYIGTTYDTASENRVFRISRFSQRGVDLSALTFRLDLKYANGGTDTLILSKEVTDEFIFLTWEIASSQLQVPGAIKVGIRATDDEVTVKWSTFNAAFYVERHLNAPGNYTGDLTEIEQMEQDHQYFKSVVDELRSNLDYRQDAEAYAVGTRLGEDVPETDETYHNNAKYYAESIVGDAEAAAASASQAASTVATLSAQFANAIAALSIDSELQDIRVQADGTTAASAGDAVRAQVNDLKGAITQGNNRNILFDTIVDSYVNHSGEIIASDGYSRSDYLDCAEYYVIKINVPAGSSYNAFYAVDMTFLSQFYTAAGDNTIYVPDGAAYFIISGTTENLSTTRILPITKAEIEAHHALPVAEAFTGYTAITGWSAPSKDYYKLNDTTATIATGSSSAPNDWQYVKQACSRGDAFIVNGNGLSGPRSWAFTDSEYTILSVEGYQVDAHDKKVVAPENAAYLLINRRATLCDRPSYFMPAGPLVKYNSDVLFEDTQTATTTSSGVTYTITNGVAHIAGETPSNASSVCNLYSMRAPKNSWIELENDHNYYIEVERSANDRACVRVVSYVDNAIVDCYDFYESGIFQLHRTAEINYLYIRYYVPAHSTVDNTIKFKLFSAPPNSVLFDSARMKGLFKLRVMQNNIGCFRYGRAPGALELTDEEYALKLANYKKFYGEIQPDILCLQEYVRYIGNGVNDARTVLYEPLYRNTSIDKTSTAKQPAIWTNAECTASNKVMYVDVDNTTVTFRYAQADLINVGLKVISMALKPNSSGVDNSSVRAAELEALLSSFEDDTNVVIASDLNVDTAAELATIIGIAESHGFHSAANGGYWGTYDTYIDPANQNPPLSYYRCIDSILVKGRIKMVNAKRLLEESTDFPDDFVFDPADDSTPDKSKTMIANSPYNHLASDHIPIIADLTFY